jgi:hypothetical protein
MSKLSNSQSSLRSSQSSATFSMSKCMRTTRVR